MNDKYFVELNGYLVKDKKINNIVDNKLDVNFLSIGNNSVSQSDDRHLGDCIVIKGDKNIIIDLGFQTDCNHLINFLNDNDINRIDYVIISHYHLDHIGGASASGLNVLLNNNTIDFSNCVFYLPHKNINWNEFTGTTFETSENIIKSLLTSKNIEYIQPDNEDELIINENLKLTFLNIGSDFYTDYYSCLDNWNLGLLESTNYNNFSMVVLLEHFKNKFLFTGDIEPLAQSKIYTYIKDIDVLKVEHHGLNYITNEKYLSELNPKYAIIGELDDLTGYELVHNTLYDLKNKGCTIYRTTLSGDITITSNYNKIESKADKKIEVNNVNYSLYEGQPILANSDLNEYLTPGIYNSYNQNNTATLINCPIIGAGFKLIVERHTQSMKTIRQTLLKNNVDGAIYTRNIIGGIYGKWQKISLGLDFSLTSSSFTMGDFDITFTETNHETRYECKNNIALLSLTFKTNEEISTGTTIITLPTNITVNGEDRIIDYGNKIINFNMTTSSGEIYPMYMGGGNQLRARKTIPTNTTIRGYVTFIID